MAYADQFVQVDGLKTRLTESGNGLLYPLGDASLAPPRGFRDKPHPLAPKSLPD